MYILVFPDGETFNTLRGCTIQKVPDGLDIEQVEEELSEDRGELVACLSDSPEFIEALQVSSTR